MAKTITIDDVKVNEVRLVRGQNGAFHVYVEYHLRPGNALIRGKFDEFTARINGQRQATALALFDGIAQEVAAIELA